MEVHQDSNRIYRCLPRENMEINKYWLCDEGRFNFHYVHDAARVIEPAVGRQAARARSGRRRFDAREAATLKGKKVAVLVGSDLTQEEAQAASTVSPEAISRAPPFFTSARLASRRRLTMRRPTSCSNARARPPISTAWKSWGSRASTRFPPARTRSSCFAAGARCLPGSQGRSKVVGVGVFTQAAGQAFRGRSCRALRFAEKDGTIVNFEGSRAEQIKRAILPPGASEAFPEILMMWANSGQQNSVAEHKGAR